MCEFCTSHGEGKKWYENMRNYTEEVFREVNSEGGMREFLGGMRSSLEATTALALRAKQRYPRIYRVMAYPAATNRLKKTHFGQIVPIEDIERVMDHFSTVVRLPCVCRRVTIGDGKRYCFGVGMDLTHIYRDLPDFRDFEVLSREEARNLIRDLDREGMTHSVWTFNTPFIGAVCNCDDNCMAYRFQVKLELGQAMWKAEYVASLDADACSGCRECEKRCYFGAVDYDSGNERCRIDPRVCFGCGACRAVCPAGAISLTERVNVPAAADSW